MDKLLKSSLGYPLKKPWEKNSTRIHENDGTSENIIQGCYWVAVDEDLKKLLEPSPKETITKTKPLKLWHAHPNGKLMGVPKFFGMSAFGKGRDLRHDGVDIKTEWNTSFILRPEQTVSVEQTLCTLEKWGGAFYTADCGFGKSVVIASLIHRIRKRAMIVVPRLTLVKQTAHDLGGNPTLDRPQILSKATVGILQGSWEKNPIDADIIVASLDSLALFKYPQEFWKQIGLVIFDEAHHMAAKTLSAIMPHVSSKRIIGFSATPNRNDGLEHVLYWLLGPTCFVYQRLPEITGKRDTVKVRRVQGAVIIDEFMYGGKLNFSAMLNSISANESRNNLLIEIALSLKERRKILLITAFREHCELLSNLLEKKGERVEMMHGTMKRKREDPLFLVATYGILEEGFDDADLDTLVFCTPRSTIQQTVGRIERTKKDKLVPLVIDVVDVNRIFESMWYKRKKFYKSRGFSVEDKKEEKKEEVWVANDEDEEFV
jgi:superfamily II DNA or RNA helicase